MGKSEGKLLDFTLKGSLITKQNQPYTSNMSTPKKKKNIIHFLIALIVDTMTQCPGAYTENIQQPKKNKQHGYRVMSWQLAEKKKTIFLYSKRETINKNKNIVCMYSIVYIMGNNIYTGQIVTAN